MKKIISLIIFSLIITPAQTCFAIVLPNGQAPSGDAREKLTTATDQNFDALKTGALKLIDAAVGKLNQAEEKISGNGNIDAATKQNALSSLQKVEDNLLKYKAQLEKATSTEEVRAINQEVIQYLKDNKDVIKENVKIVLENTAVKAAAKAEELKKQLELVLKTLKATCPNEKETIAALENQLKQLETEIASLQSNIKSKNPAAMKQDIKDLASLSQQIIPNVQKISSSCLK